MANKAKQKGKRFENKIAELIREILNLDKTECHRASSSGTSDWDYGDIYIKDCPIIIECKFYNKFSAIDFFPSLKKNILNHLNQLKESSIKYKQDFPSNDILPILVISRPYYPEFYIFDLEDLMRYGLEYKEFNYARIDGYVILFDRDAFSTIIIKFCDIIRRLNVYES